MLASVVVLKWFPPGPILMHIGSFGVWPVKQIFREDLKPSQISAICFIDVVPNPLLIPGFHCRLQIYQDCKNWNNLKMNYKYKNVVSVVCITSDFIKNNYMLIWDLFPQLN